MPTVTDPMLLQQPRTSMERKLDARYGGINRFRKHCFRLWKDDGLNLLEIARKERVKYNTFYEWYKRWREDASVLMDAGKEADEGLTGWLDIPYQPRPKKEAA